MRIAPSPQIEIMTLNKRILKLKSKLVEAEHKYKEYVLKTCKVVSVRVSLDKFPIWVVSDEHKEVYSKGFKAGVQKTKKTIKDVL